nr:nicotinate-nucleotide adenylyltransferase [Burkholderiales bacterium]
MAGPVGVLGGTFDPIHVAHLALAHAARDAVGLAEVRFIPSARPPHRDAPAAAAAHRLAMVEAAIAGTAGFVADARELHRLTPSWTIDTLTSLRAEVGTDRPLVLLMGEDAFALLHTWHRWTELTATAHLVVARRPDAAPLQA